MDSKIKWVLTFIGILVFTIVFFIIANPVFNPATAPFWAFLQESFRQNMLAWCFTIMLYTFSLALMTNIITKIAVDVNQLKRWQAAIDKFKEQEKRAKKAREIGRPMVKLEKMLTKKDSHIKSLQTKMAGQRFKPTIITMVPMMILFIILSYFVFPVPIVVAIFPFNISKVPMIGTMMGPVALYQVGRALYVINNGFYLYYIGWYMICMFGFNKIMQKLIGTKFDTSSTPFGF